MASWLLPYMPASENSFKPYRQPYYSSTATGEDPFFFIDAGNKMFTVRFSTVPLHTLAPGTAFYPWGQRGVWVRTYTRPGDLALLPWSCSGSSSRRF